MQPAIQQLAFRHRMTTGAACCFLLSLALARWQAALGNEPSFVFRNVAAQAELRQPLAGMMAHAAGWGDVNSDGWMDLWVGSFADRPVANYQAGGAQGPVPNQLLINHNGRFTPVDQPAIAWLGRASGVVLADLDNDGWPDLLVTNNGRLGKGNLLYHNRGQGRYVNVTDQAGAALAQPETARSATVLDFDGDGLLDLLIVATVGRDQTRLYRNLGGMKFALSAAIPPEATGLGAAAADVTGNGWPDVLIGGPNRLFINLGKGNFREATELGLAWGFDREDDAPSCGVAFGDIDRDGDVDLLLGSHRKAPWREPNSLRLFRNLGCTTQEVRFEEVTQEVGLTPVPMRLPHVEIRDFDNDGWPDLYTATAVFGEGRVYPAIYRNQGAKHAALPQFVDTAWVHRPDFPDQQEDLPAARSSIFYDRLVENRKVMYYAPGPSGDFDNDGRLDLFLASWFPRRPSLLLRNETQAGNYLDVEVLGSGRINRMGIGTKVCAYRPGRAGVADALLASEEIATSYGYCSAQPPVAHLGLGAQRACDLVLTLPHGRGRVVRQGVVANQRLQIKVEAQD